MDQKLESWLVAKQIPGSLNSTSDLIFAFLEKFVSREVLAILCQFWKLTSVSYMIWKENRKIQHLSLQFKMKTNSTGDKENMFIKH